MSRLSIARAVREMTRARRRREAATGDDREGPPESGRSAEQGAEQARDRVPTFWLTPDELGRLLGAMAPEQSRDAIMLFDVFCLDDTLGDGGPGAVTLVYAFGSLHPHARLRVKVRVSRESPTVPSAAPFFASAEGYEREIAARAGVVFRGHPNPYPLPSDERERTLLAADELDVDVALPRALALETLLGIEVPPRADAIRVLRCELLRVASHLFWYGAFSEQVGAGAPTLYASADARRVLEVAYAVGGAHPERFLVGGVKDDLPPRWRDVLEIFLEEMRMRALDYAEGVLVSPILQAATKGVSPLEVAEAVSLGVTGPVLRSAGLSYDLRKAAPYCGYERYEFEVPTGVHGDLYDRARVRIEELRQSLRILQQCVAKMPDGDVVATVPRGLQPGEAMAEVEGSRGAAACYVASDGGALFVHHRTPSFAHLQALDSMANGYDEDDVAKIASSVDLGARPRH